MQNIAKRLESQEDLVKTLADLQRSNDELKQYTYIASHDLQEPLRTVTSYTQLLAKRYTGRLDAHADEFIAYAVEGCTRMQSIIQDLLSHARAGQVGNPLGKASGEEQLDHALENLRSAIKQSEAVVTRDALPDVAIDGTQLCQVFQNLVGNAIKFHRAEAPRIHVSAARGDGAEWIFSVRDNGLGIEPQYFERIFFLFQRLHGREEFEGTGTGLAICKKVVERRGGRIWVESAPGKGSTFYFALPETESRKAID